MVPLTLELENFLSYRQRQEIDLEGIHTACLAGPNGNGKSSLLEAITWALWGEADRDSGGGKPDEAILNESEKLSEGASQMEVILRFETEGDVYEVQRQYRESASGKTTRGELSFRTEEGKDLTAGSMRETQSLINEIVGLEYDTFVNSSFLVQGRSDEFTSKTPSERKEVLTDILRLGRFDSYYGETRRRMKETAKKITSLESRIETAEENLEGAEEREDELAEVDDLLEQWREYKTDCEERLTEWREAKDDLGQPREDLDRLQGEQQETRQNIHDVEEEIFGLIRKVRDLESLLSQSQEIQENYERYQNLQNRRDELDEQRDKHEKLKWDLESKKGDLKEARTVLERKRENTQSEIDRLLPRLNELCGTDFTEAAMFDRPDIGDAFFEDRFDRALQIERELDSTREGIEDDKQALEEIREELVDLREKRTSIQSRIEQKEEFIESLSDVEGGSCPTCGQELTPEHAEREREAAREEVTELQNQLDEVSETIEYREERKEELEYEIDREQENLQDLRQAETPEDVEEDIREAEDMIDELMRAQDRLHNLEDPEFADDIIGYNIPELEKEVSSLTQKLDDHPYDSEEMERVKSELADLGSAPDRFQSLQNAAAEEERLKEDLSEAWDRRRDLQQQAQEIEIGLDEAEERLMDLRTVEEEIKELTEEVEHSEEKIGEFLQQQSRLEEQVRRDEEEREALEEAKTEKKEAENRKTILSHLKDAFSKHGIPSLIIESAIPDIEDRANALLEKMPGEMEMRLETTRETQSGSTSDTLDIWIKDQGWRRYETFSGGEGFRINLALRVALSQLLARRSGAPMRTLVIDEGFGTQDDHGLQKCREAIHSVSEEFDRVLVITHLEQLKDAFDTRIDVEKDPATGSTVHIR